VTEKKYFHRTRQSHNDPGKRNLWFIDPEFDKEQIFIKGLPLALTGNHGLISGVNATRRSIPALINVIYKQLVTHVRHEKPATKVPISGVTGDVVTLGRSVQ